ncbi:MAG: hypothetical protein R3D44_04025 [Hyphomicrobiaceae bacterium]
MGTPGILADVGRALADTLVGRKRRRYEHSVEIGAPQDIVWQMLKARDLAFDGPFPIRVLSQPVPGSPDLERVSIEMGDRRLHLLTRIVEERPGNAILYQLLPEGTDAALVEGDDDYVAFVLTEAGGRTRLDLTRETSPRNWLARLTVPMGLRTGGRRYKRKAEAMLREALERPPEPGPG